MAKSRGRPAKDDDERKDAHVIVRVDTSERQEFEDAAKIAGLDLSKWIRDRLKQAAKKEKKKASATKAIPD
jgi:antitoxin component of RelBE/YafQ-DinJ toxin-antitoxin module